MFFLFPLSMKFCILFLATLPLVCGFSNFGAHLAKFETFERCHRSASIRCISKFRNSKCCLSQAKTSDAQVCELALLE